MAYQIKILYVTDAEPDLVELVGFDHPQAEAFTAQLRYDVEEAKAIDSPIVETSLPGESGAELAMDPRIVRSIDLEEV